MKRAEDGETQVYEAPVRGYATKWFTVRANSILALSSRECRDVVVRNADVGEKRFWGVVQPVHRHQQRLTLGPTP